MVNKDFLPVGQSVAVRVGIQRIRPQKDDLVPDDNPVNFFAIRQSIPVRVWVVRIGAGQIFLKVGEPVPVGVGIRRR